MLRRRNHRGDRDRPGPRTASDFVDPAHELVAGFKTLALESKTRTSTGGDHIPNVPRRTSARRVYDPIVETGTRVEVRSRFDQRWARGFEVVESIAEPSPGYLIRRRSDNSILPLVFAPEEVREERRRTDDMWWV